MTVYYDSTDAAGFVYHANYLVFAERARSDWLSELGYPVDRLVPSFGGFFVVQSCDVRFLRPARLGDRIEVETSLQRMRGTRLDFLQVVRRGPDTLAELNVVVAFIDISGKPKRIPDELARLTGSLMASNITSDG
jgi:acyl-CoA thioester hydrolase